MTGEILGEAIKRAVEVQGVSWEKRSRIASYQDLGVQLEAALAYADGLTSREAVAAIIGESAQETDWYCSTVEYGGPSTQYAPWYGRGMIQLTWRRNYEGFQSWLREYNDNTDIISDPDIVTRGQYAWLTAIYYFSRHIDLSYIQAQNWNAISGLVNAGNANYYVPGYALRANACDGAYAVLSERKWNYNKEDEMALDSIVTRPDGHQASLNDTLAYMDMRLENLASIVDELARLAKGGGIEKRGDGESGMTDAAIEIGWLPRNFADIRELIAKTAQRSDIDALVAAMNAARATSKPSYTVKKGDTMQAICKRLGVDMSTVLAANPGVDPDNIKIGQVIYYA